MGRGTPIWLVFLLLACTGLARGEPFIFQHGILNGASFTPPALANGAIARGSIFSIFGRDLGPAEGVQVSVFPLPTELAGVSVAVCFEGQCQQAFPLFVRGDQVNAIMPSSAALGATAVRVTYNGTASNFSPIRVVEASVGIFAANSAGAGPAIGLNFVAPGNEPLNSTLLSARRGQVVTLWGTGLGAGLNADNMAPQAGDLPTKVEIWVGGAAVTRKLYSGRSPCCAGVDQISFEVPANAPAGCYVPIQIRVNGASVSSSVTLAVDESSGRCRDPHNPFHPLFIDGGRVAAVFAERLSVNADIDPNPAKVQTTEWAVLLASEERADPFHFHPAFSWPPLGSCLTYAARGDFLRDPSIPFQPPSGRYLDIGAQIEVSAGNRRIADTLKQPGRGGGRVGADFDGSELFFRDAASLAATTPGGADVGPLNGALAIEPPPNWTNRDSVRRIVPGQPFQVTWQTPNPQGRAVVVGGASIERAGHVTALFACPVDAATGSFTVPAAATTNLPLTTGELGEIEAVIGLGMGPITGSGMIEASGVDLGLGVFSSWVANSVSVEAAAK